MSNFYHGNFFLTISRAFMNVMYTPPYKCLINKSVDNPDVGKYFLSVTSFAITSYEKLCLVPSLNNYLELKGRIQFKTFCLEHHCPSRHLHTLKVIFYFEELSLVFIEYFKTYLA